MLAVCCVYSAATELLHPTHTKVNLLARSDMSEVPFDNNRGSSSSSAGKNQNQVAANKRTHTS